jgi:hypothetical protein
MRGTDQRAVNWMRHPQVEMVWPVCIHLHAFGRNMTKRSLPLSLDDALHENEMLVPMKRLINGVTTRRRNDPAVAGGSYHRVPRGAGAVLSAL